ncbi:MAG TPA: histidine kinase dimerization/phospho-acceptor domain-containing protein [Xanthobacteraceae bacterium]
MSELSDHASTGPRGPMRFVWQMDAEQRFTIVSDEFAALMGRATAAALGRPWVELAAALSLDPEDQVTAALASRETWSGLRIAWPVDDGAERLMVELSGLPVFDRERIFRGYRGFGICRDVARLAALVDARRAIGTPATPPSSENVVPLRPAREPVPPTLSAVERNAFHELTRKLHERLTAAAPTAAGAAASGHSPPAEQDKPQDRAPAIGAAERAAPQPNRKSDFKFDFLARLSHEIRNPLNAIIGFSEVMAQEKLGPVGNERYRQYARDIHNCGTQLLSLVNDLIDLTRIEAGKIELDLAGVALNPLTQQCVAIMRPQANRARVIIRTSLSPALPGVVADARALQRVVLDLISHSSRLAGAGGQVIVSTTRTDLGEVILRLRDSGSGMSESEIAGAFAPFGQVATSVHRIAGGTGLGLPLTKALIEANGATFGIRSVPLAGTLIEVTFPQDRVLAEEMR